MPATHHSAAESIDFASPSQTPLPNRELDILERSTGTVLTSALRRAYEELSNPRRVLAGFDNLV
ncbi:hypothetical protein [Actinomadura sp.]|uniref:hypothetical protein n=1 Tax=Actinomadura sp. TaxID=1989 RepID=UPI003349A9DC